MWQLANGLWFQDGCLCAGGGCGGHSRITPGYQGAAQHTYTMACDGFHEPGPCPLSQRPYTVHT